MIMNNEKMAHSATYVVLRRFLFKEWSKENVKTQTTRSRTREGKRLDMTSFLESLKTYAASVLIF
ncbi:hypothetical protein T08_6841 [Trichinella sp. T8]|nr:hypothetical protein T08_6841 [Trichinella sp. T8]